MSLDEEILQVLGNLEEYSDSHPVLYSLWKKFIHNKIKDVEETLKHCESAMESMNIKPDITLEQFALFHSLFSHHVRETH